MVGFHGSMLTNNSLIPRPHCRIVLSSFLFGHSSERIIGVLYLQICNIEYLAEKCFTYEILDCYWNEGYSIDVPAFSHESSLAGRMPGIMTTMEGSGYPPRIFFMLSPHLIYFSLHNHGNLTNVCFLCGYVLASTSHSENLSCGRLVMCQRRPDFSEISGARSTRSV